VQCVTAQEVGPECSYLETCCDTSRCWYETDDATFPCNGTDCRDAAERVVDHCTDDDSGGSRGDDEESSGCSVSGPRAPGAPGLLLLLSTALGAVLRRRLRRAP
jgi:hypothetical protein